VDLSIGLQSTDCQIAQASAEGVGSGEGRRSPSPVWRSGGIVPRKFLKFKLQICAFWCIFAPVLDAEFNATVLILEV